MTRSIALHDAPSFRSTATHSTLYNPSSTHLLEGDDISLSINYLPAKFSTLISSNIHHRKGKNSIRGSEVDDRAQRSEAWLYDVDDDPMSKSKKRMQWNEFKWALFIANLLLTLYSIISLIFCLLTWFNIWPGADVIRVGNHPDLVVSTIACSSAILTCLLGWAGILLNNRSFLATYTFFLWVTFVLIVIPGYTTYHRRTFDLEVKIDSQWSKGIRPDGRLRIQNQLGCCGYYSPFVQATLSKTCYARSLLPGCKKRYMDFERRVLGLWFKVSFGLVPVHIGVMVTGLLCSNHVTYRFGKGMMPKAYRLSEKSMAAIMENYARELGEVYGPNVAADIRTNSPFNSYPCNDEIIPNATTLTARNHRKALVKKKPSQLQDERPFLPRPSRSRLSQRHPTILQQSSLRHQHVSPPQLHIPPNQNYAQHSAFEMQPLSQPWDSSLSSQSYDSYDPPLVGYPYQGHDLFRSYPEPAPGPEYPSHSQQFHPLQSSGNLF